MNARPSTFGLVPHLAHGKKKIGWTPKKKQNEKPRNGPGNHTSPLRNTSLLPLRNGTNHHPNTSIGVDTSTRRRSRIPTVNRVHPRIVSERNDVDDANTVQRQKVDGQGQNPLTLLKRMVKTTMNGKSRHQLLPLRRLLHPLRASLSWDRLRQQPSQPMINPPKAMTVTTTMSKSDPTMYPKTKMSRMLPLGNTIPKRESISFFVPLHSTLAPYSPTFLFAPQLLPPSTR